MNLIKSKLGATLLLAASASMAQAATYNVSGTFYEPMAKSVRSYITLYSTEHLIGMVTTLTNLSGTMNSAMELHLLRLI